MDVIKRAYQEFTMDLPPCLSVEALVPSPEESERIMQRIRELHRNGELLDSIQRGYAEW